MPSGIASSLTVGAWQHPLPDGLNSVRGIVSDALAVLETVSYTPYGVPDTALTATDFAFTGEIRDANGLQYHRARYYDPALTVWGNLDPFEGAQGRPLTLNRYSYTNGNSVNRVDPTGMFDWIAHTADQGDCLLCMAREMGLNTNQEFRDFINGMKIINPGKFIFYDPDCTGGCPSEEFPWLREGETYKIPDGYSGGFIDAVNGVHRRHCPCGSSSRTVTPMPTATPNPTNTPAPTFTPLPSSTPTASATSTITPTPSITNSPTPTYPYPTPTASPVIPTPTPCPPTPRADRFTLLIGLRFDVSGNFGSPVAGWDFNAEYQVAPENVLPQNWRRPSDVITLNPGFQLNSSISPVGLGTNTGVLIGIVRQDSFGTNSTAISAGITWHTFEVDVSVVPEPSAPYFSSVVVFIGAGGNIPAYGYVGANTSRVVASYNWNAFVNRIIRRFWDWLF